MTLEDELHDAMIALYRQAGEATGYWGTRYLQAVRRHGGLARAREMLRPRSAGQRRGLDALLAAGRPKLTFEWLVLQGRFAPLFTPAELAVARERLGDFVEQATKTAATRERLYPDEFEPGVEYPEGARKQVRVNAYERSAAARRACLAHHKCRCAACGLAFEERYGEIGKGFMHVHHLQPLASAGEERTVDPVRDLVPVCPNCHAMLHRRGPPLSVAELQSRLAHAAA